VAVAEDRVTMVDVALIVVPIFIFLCFIAVNIYFVIYFQHPEDKNVAWWPKILVISGLAWGETCVMMLTMDVLNTPPFGGWTIPMQILWIVFLCLIAAWIVLLIPYSIFYYEADDPGVTTCHKVMSAFWWTLLCMVVAGAICIVVWIFAGVASVPYVPLSVAAGSASPFLATSPSVPPPSQLLYIRMNFLLFIFSFTAFVGTFLFVVFAGVGLTALPVHLINGFRQRPRYVPLDKWARMKLELGERCTDLYDTGVLLKDGKKASRKHYSEFKAAVYLLEEEWERLKLSREVGNRGTQVLAYVKLALGIVAVCFSLAWMIQIIVTLLWRPTAVIPFLNDMLVLSAQAWGGLPVLLYGFFCVYMLACTLTGNFYFGIRIPLLCSIHPMKPNGTLMSSFMFNVLVFLLAAVACTQFCTLTLNIFTAGSIVNNIFNVTTANMLGIKYVWLYIWYALAVIPVLTLLFMLVVTCRGTDSKGFSKELQRRLAESREADHKDRCCGWC
jgi:LMBR1 domain-containing protein 1